MEVESKTVLCCGAKTWGLVIGWLQIILAGCLLLVGIAGVANPEALAPLLDGIREDGPKSQMDIMKYDAKLFVNTICIALIIMAIIAMIFPSLLIVGIHQGSMIKIKIWYVLQILGVILSVIQLFRDLFAGPSTTNIIIDIVGISVNGFFAWVVKVHINELEMSKRMMNGSRGNSQFGYEGHARGMQIDATSDHPLGYEKLGNEI